MRWSLLICALCLAACEMPAVNECHRVCDEKASGAGSWIDCRKACDDWKDGVSTPTPINTFWAASVTKNNIPVAGFWTKIPMDKKKQNAIQACLEMATIENQGQPAAGDNGRKGTEP